MKRALVLRRESLAELTDGDLVAVAGGDYSGGQGLSCPVIRCLDTEYWRTLLNCRPESVVC